MTDYIKSLKAGLKAAKTAEKNRLEINSVFDQLNGQLDRSTDGALLIERQERYVNYEFTDLSKIIKGEKRETYITLIAKNKKVQNVEVVDLSTWKEAHEGYPCQIIYGDEHIYCEDKEALEHSIQTLLSDSLVGEKLYKVINEEINPDLGGV